MRIALITPLVDPSDPLLGFIHTWVEHLAQRVEHLSVIQLWRSDPPLPANVRLYSMDRNAPGGKPAALARLTTTLAKLCWQDRIDGVIAHMGPIFAVCAVPIVKPARIPLALWYAHGAVSPMLRLAHALVDRAGTSTPDGLRISSRKITITGQGIDTDVFSPVAGRDPRLLVSIGRISPIKHYEVIIDAMAILRDRGTTEVRLRIVGGATLPGELSYRERLMSQVRELGLNKLVEIVAGVPHSQIAAEYQQAGIFLSCSQTGSLDKAILEAASCGCIPLTTNPALSAFFRSEKAEHMPSSNTDEAVADLVDEWLGRQIGEREARAALLRERTVQEHGVDHLADQLVQLVRPLDTAAAGRSQNS